MKAYFYVVAFSLLLLPILTSKVQFRSLFGGGPRVETINTSQLYQLLAEQQKSFTTRDSNAKTNFVLVDVRSDKEIEVSVIPGAISKTQFEKDMRKHLGKLVIPYCTVGVRSGDYAKQLAKRNVKVVNYKGSILEWVDSGLPLVTLTGQPTNRVHTYSNKYRVSNKYEQVAG